mgnify:FL=1
MRAQIAPMNASANEGGGADTAADPEWHERFAQALASRDLETYLAFLHDDCTLQINNGLPLYGKLAIRASYAAYLQTFRSLRTEIIALMSVDRQSTVEALLHYVCIDGTSEVVQCAYLLEHDENGLATSVRVYGNARRVFKPFMSAKA